ncbi:hypothetical protein ABEV21_07320, partial [Geobacillus stearothermophilus]|uniref:hypothetical protein n=1 Tax=Geobacillus stearothermophilus TaxID=1422 RepID=UPI003D1AB551
MGNQAVHLHQRCFPCLLNRSWAIMNTANKTAHGDDCPPHFAKKNPKTTPKTFLFSNYSATS